MYLYDNLKYLSFDVNIYLLFYLNTIVCVCLLYDPSTFKSLAKLCKWENAKNISLLNVTSFSQKLFYFYSIKEKTYKEPFDGCNLCNYTHISVKSKIIAYVFSLLF